MFLISQQLSLKDEPRMSVLVALFPYGSDLIDGYVADVVVLVFEVKHVTIDLHNLAAETRSAGTEHVDFFID